MADRTIHFEGIPNARDLGGLTNREGRTIRKGLLIRSAGLFEASSHDIRRLEREYRLQAVIDLRTTTERQEKPDVPIPGAKYCPIPVFDEQVAGISHERQKPKLSALPPMASLYQHMVTDGDCRKHLGQAAIAVMTQPFSEGSVLWHCTEGKDRCGLLSAILLMALGVTRQVIAEDYLLTNAVNGPKAQRFYQGMLTAGRSQQEADALRDVFLAKDSYLQSAFDGIDQQFPEEQAFLTLGLGIPEETLSAFRAQLLL